MNKESVCLHHADIDVTFSFLSFMPSVSLQCWRLYCRCMGKSSLEREFICIWQVYYPDTILEPERRIIPGRRYSFDYVHLPSKVAIELQGGTYVRSRSAHSSGTGLDRDYEKNNLAQIHGYLIFQLSCKMITPQWLEQIHGVILKRI